MAKGCDVKQEKITFGGEGKGKGKFQSISGVAVSADNEIFVIDGMSQRVQVFSINGAFLRLFPTVLPGESKTMYPRGVALDMAPGYLWVLGKSSRPNERHVVQYSKNGQPIKKFDESLKGYFRVIAMDVRNNKVIVGDTNTIMMFHSNGSRLWSSEVPREGRISAVTSDKEGNVLLTDWNNSVYKYNASGVKIFEFGTKGDREGQLNSPLGICLDTSGHIIVANFGNHRVDMFTSQGEFVRTIANILPFEVAMGPCGELVVTSRCKEPARDLTAARPNCKSRSAPYHTPHGSRRATDRAPDGSLTETGRKTADRSTSRPRQGAVKEHSIVTLTVRRTLGVMTPAGVYAEDMPNGRQGCSREGVFGVDERFVFNKALVTLAGGRGSGREVSASRRLSDVYAYFDLSTAVGHSEPKEGLLRVMATSVTAVTYGPPTTPISELDLAIVNAFSPGGLMVPSGVSQISAMLFTTGRGKPRAEA
ncbi:hypothetical protein Bbelb_036990 [Branchiostoma belcheri]|nr:hypothetical protein Bbelb_036990 [Branchiostoma belcheri]